MDLIVFGDSWTYGDELIPDTPLYRNSVNIGGLVYKNYTFKRYHNYSVNGASLQHIILQILTYLNSDNYSPDNLVLVGLTSPMRRLRFNNINKQPTNWSTHDFNEFSNYGDTKIVNSPDFKKWWKSNLVCHVNVRNDLLNYFNACFSIKSLLSSHSKYIIWQSIDGGLYDKVEENFDEVISDYENEKSEYTIHHENNYFFDKSIVKKIINQDTLSSQIWLNFHKESWIDFLHNSDKSSLFVKGGYHPSEKGIYLWYDEFLKKYIDKVLYM